MVVLYSVQLHNVHLCTHTLLFDRFSDETPIFRDNYLLFSAMATDALADWKKDLNVSMRVINFVLCWCYVGLLVDKFW